MSKIRKDDHSLYVRVNGSVYRPIETPWSYTGMQGAATHGITQFAEGEEVKLSHMRSTPFARLRGAPLPTQKDRVELWHSHGSYYDSQGDVLKSEACWAPRDDI
jgi:hypothetical protein